MPTDALAHHTRSPPESPIRKRQRLSSPNYDDQLDDLSAEDLAAFDQIDFSFSQAQPRIPALFKTATLHEEPSTDTDSPFCVSPTHTSTSAKPTTTKPCTSSFKVASSLKDVAPSSSQDPPDNCTMSVPPGVALFRSARVIDEEKIKRGEPPSPDKENAGVLLFSQSALKQARAKDRLWDAMYQKEVEEAEKLRHGLGTIELLVPVPAPLKGKTPSKSSKAMPPPTSTPLPLSRRTGPMPFKTPGMASQSRSFRPLSLKGTNTGWASTPRSNAPSNNFETPKTPKTTALVTPSKIPRPTALQTPKSMLSTPHRSIGLSKNVSSRFVSPFKSPMLPPGAASRPQPGSLMKSQLQKRVYPPAAKPTPSPSMKNIGQIAPLSASGMQGIAPLKFDNPVASSLKTLETSSLRPQEYSRADLEAMGLNVDELEQVHPSTALHYCFYSFPSADGEDAEPQLLNASAAYNELIKQGCSLATEGWVNNHWSLILWKLAGMAKLDPVSEQKVDTKRWCWENVMKQLRYRYDKELDGGKRPIFRRMVARDGPSTVPMVVCVSAIMEDENGEPMLEVTDGWYRLRAEIDAPLARAVKKGAIRVGRKLAICGARLNSEKKDGAEILEGSESVALKISGNSSSLAPWYAKLGAQKERYISTLHSLTSDGGVISCLDVEIVKVHPVGFIEFVEQEGGGTLHVGPRNAAEEAKEVDKWEKRREMEVFKLRQAFEKKVAQYMDYLSRLENKAEKSKPTTADDEMPDHILSLYDDLEEHSTALETIAAISSSDARWLAQVVRQNFEIERDKMGSEIEQELADLCPPRNVRNFRVLVIRDTRTERRSSHRNAQLTVWDANRHDMSEGSTSGTFAAGQRYLVTNLIPTQQRSWMKNEPGAEIFMATRRDTQWVKRKSTVTV